MHIIAKPSQSINDGTMASYPMLRAFSPGTIHPVMTPIGPTRPHVPIPEEIGVLFCVIMNTQVAIGPVIADATTGGIHSKGFLKRFGMSSIDVPRPMDKRPLLLLSRYEQTANPII